MRSLSQGLFIINCVLCTENAPLVCLFWLGGDLGTSRDDGRALESRRAEDRGVSPDGVVSSLAALCKAIHFKYTTRVGG